jgi:hypothetical protein
MIGDWAINFVADTHHLLIENGISHAIRIGSELKSLNHSWSVVSRPLEGEAPMIDVAVGYSKSNTSPILKLFLSRLDELVGPNQNELKADQGEGGPCDLGIGSASKVIVVAC